MTTVNYDNRSFKMISSSADDQKSIDGVIFEYHQVGDIVWGTYQGGSVAFGTLLAKVDYEGNLDLRFQHIYKDGQVKTGTNYSQLTILEDGRYHLDETFQFMDDDSLEYHHSAVEEFIS